MLFRSDPIGGAYAVEALTDQIERDATDLIAVIDRRGGPLAAVESGYIQQQIQEAAYRTQQALDAGEAVVVGVNRFRDATEDAAPHDVFQIDPGIERRQIERVRALRVRRAETPWREALARVEQCARDGSNLVPPIVSACEAYATLGEIADALRRVFEIGRAHV